MPQDPLNLIWIDLEMTGLDPLHDRIIEIATVVTDKELNVLAEGPAFAVHQADYRLQGMDEWNTRQHAKSGLAQRVHDSRISAQEAERRTVEFLSRWVPAGASPMCGNTICQDRRFLVNWMPELERYFHYRNLDVSTLKELSRRWYPDLPGFGKSSTHLALDDVRDSIEELKYYRRELLRAHA